MAPRIYAPQKLRLAILGLGNISRCHIAALQQLPQAEIVAGCDILPERLEWFRQQPGCQKARLYQDYREMLAREELDAVDICTPNGVHAPAAIASLEAGCHVMVEKPMAMDPAECQKMNRAAKMANRLLAVGFQIRYTPVVQMAKRAAEAGLLGEILYVKIHAMRRRGVPNWGVFGRKDLQGGGPMIDIGVHQIESAHYVMGEPKPVAASGRTWTFLGDKPSQVVSKWPNWDYKSYTVEDLCVGQVRFADGSLMEVESAFCSHLEEDTAHWEIMGTKGGFSTATGTLFHDLAGTMDNSTAAYLPPHPSPTDFVSKLGDFLSAIQNGTPLHASGEEGMAVQKIIDGLYRSAEKQGKEVSIP